MIGATTLLYPAGRSQCRIEEWNGVGKGCFREATEFAWSGKDYLGVYGWASTINENNAKDGLSRSLHRLAWYA